MIPGFTTKLSEETLASAATIYPKKDLIILTGTTALATIVPAYGGGFSGVLFIVPTNAAGVATLTTDNIGVAVTMAQFRVTVLVWSKSQSKWYPGAIS
jgi:hypothetical protein